MMMRSFALMLLYRTEFLYVRSLALLSSHRKWHSRRCCSPPRKFQFLYPSTICIYTCARIVNSSPDWTLYYSNAYRQLQYFFKRVCVNWWNYHSRIAHSNSIICKNRYIVRPTRRVYRDSVVNEDVIKKQTNKQMNRFYFYNRLYIYRIKWIVKFNGCRVVHLFFGEYCE